MPTATPVAVVVVSPTSLHPNHTLTVSGTQFLANEPVNIFWDSTSSSALRVATTTTAGSFNTTITSPQAAYGTHSIIAVGQVDGRSARAAVRITPAGFLLYSKGNGGLRNAAAGAGFGSRETVKAFWGSLSGPLLGSTTTISTGAFAGATAITFAVPSSASGTYTVYLVGQRTGATATTAFTVTPALSAAPSSGAHGSRVVVAGSGYGAGESVTVRWDCTVNACTGPVLGTANTAANGVFSGLTVTIPSSAAVGQHMLGAIGAVSKAFATRSFTVR